MLTSLPLDVGIGLKPQHYQALLPSASPGCGADAPSPGSWADQPRLPGWVEVHPQNYFADGGPALAWLDRMAAHYPISLHSTGLSLGSADGHSADDLAGLARLDARLGGAAALSDHLSFSGNAHDRLADLLPIPYTHGALDHMSAQIDQVQQRLGRALMIENPSRMLAYVDGDMDEAAFLNALARRTGCGILLDLNNIVVSAANLAHLGLSAGDWLDRIDPAHVGQLHLAGHAREDHDDGPLLIDDHGSPVGDACWTLYRRFLAAAGPRPTLIEWDTNVPDLPVLLDEVARARAIMAPHSAAKGAQGQVDHVVAG